jgi:hypothetical protein
LYKIGFLEIGFGNDVSGRYWLVVFDLRKVEKNTIVKTEVVVINQTIRSALSYALVKSKNTNQYNKIEPAVA